MSTSENLNNIMQPLFNYTRNYPASQIVGELKVVTERIGFARLDISDDTPMDKVHEQLDFILNRDVSTGVIRFVHYLADKHLIGVLINDAGQVFIEQCGAYLSKLKQLTFQTPVPIKRDQQIKISAELLSLYPVSSKVIFTVDPEIVAGFILYDAKSVVVDYSHKTRVAKLLQQYIKAKVPLK